ncbi:nuclear transport factor 2 family protein [Agarivorans aestuarii]|uniref:Nuclear transport factor 2 family protein n=1 Tax=Agarivorans aestuarii TaxID=1563703 RepID=A0ABU7G8V5_9ALTE|nr:nuclear transport factor 2 family protein [Agarivorans aestuarii]MEE1675781.1 nuclear transport factor 2 family protein [Agarivorans aestuarii]
MNDIQTAFTDFSGMLKNALGEKLDPSAESFIDMVARDGVMEFPYAPEGAVKKIEGSEALAKYLLSVSEVISIGEISNPTVHHTQDPNVVIIEFECAGRGLKTGRAYNQRYISVITLKNGKIQKYLDYWNPIIALDAIGDLSSPTQSEGDKK